MILNGYFTSRNGKKYCIEIDNANVRGTMTLGADPVVISYDMDNLEAGAMTVSAEINVIADRDLSGIYTDTPMGTKARIYDVESDEVIFYGYMSPSEWDVDNNGVDDQYSIEAVDPLSALKYYRYELECGMQPKTKDAERKATTLLSMLKRAAAKCGITKIMATADVDVIVSEDALLPVNWDEETNWLTWADALQLVARGVGACVYVWGDTLRCDGVKSCINNVQTWFGEQLIGPSVNVRKYTYNGARWITGTDTTEPWVYDYELVRLSRRRDLQRSIVPAKSRITANYKRSEYSTLVPDPMDKTRFCFPDDISSSGESYGMVNGRMVGEWHITGRPGTDGEPHKDYKAADTQWVVALNKQNCESVEELLDGKRPADYDLLIKDRMRVLPRAKRVPVGADVWLEVEVFRTTRPYLDDWNTSLIVNAGFTCNGREVTYDSYYNEEQPGFYKIMLRCEGIGNDPIDLQFDNPYSESHTYIRSIKSYWIEHNYQPAQTKEYISNELYVDSESREYLCVKMAGEAGSQTLPTTGNISQPRRIQKGTVEVEHPRPLKAAMFKGVVGVVIAASWDVAAVESRLAVIEEKAYEPKPDHDDFEILSVGGVEVIARPAALDAFGGRVAVTINMRNVTVRNTTTGEDETIDNITPMTLANRYYFTRTEKYKDSAMCNGEYFESFGTWTGSTLILPNLVGSEYLDDVEVTIRVTGRVWRHKYEQTVVVIQHPFYE